MFEIAVKEKPTNEISLETKNPIQRLTAFWAFSEAGLGGVLHITRLPFKGIFIAGAATLFISLIGQLSRGKGAILKSTFLVVVVKFLVSPHTPVTAAIAVFAQGLFGELFFLSNKLKKILIPVFVVFIQFITAVQKILIVTILFGQNFWITIDDYSNSLLNQFITLERIEFSFLIIGGYVIIHVLAGFFLGLFILKLSKHLEETNAGAQPRLNEVNGTNISVNNSVQKKQWFQKPSGIAILIFFVAVLSLSFFVPEWAASSVSDIVLMIVRAIIIITLWYFLISPLLRKILSKIVTKQKTKHLEEINSILHFFPLMRKIVSYSWKNSKSFKGIKRVENFLFSLIQYSISG